MAAFSAGFTVLFMTKLRLPVSTSQAVVGAIIGWNLFSGYPTDLQALTKIVSTWIACPLLAAVIGVVLFKLTTAVVGWTQVHIVRLDSLTRLGLILAGIFGSYALGANNIANVMGVFVPANPFTSFSLGGFLQFSGIQQLFLIGALAIAVGVFTYSKRVMLTVGSDLLPLSPLAAWVVVVSHSIVLFMFASQGLENILASNGLPTIPLVPVSSSQAVIGAVIGIGLLQGGRNIKWGVLLNISSGWVTTPVVACLICFTMLFFLQNRQEDLKIGMREFLAIGKEHGIPVMWTEASPWASVTDASLSRVPPLVTTRQLTLTPDMGAPVPSSTLTTNGWGSVPSMGPLWPSPLTFAKPAGATAPVPG